MQNEGGVMLPRGLEFGWLNVVIKPTIPDTLKILQAAYQFAQKFLLAIASRHRLPFQLIKLSIHFHLVIVFFFLNYRSQSFKFQLLKSAGESLIEVVRKRLIRRVKWSNLFFWITLRLSDWNCSMRAFMSATFNSFTKLKTRAAQAFWMRR